MSKNKPRSQKNRVKFHGFDTQINCPNYEISSNGRQWCHDQGWKVQGAMTDQSGKLLCKGNRFNCLKQKYRWWASLSQKIKNKYKLMWSK